ncbi:MAG: hypothetical protein ACI9YH_003887 [Colwellia sp.]
MYIHLQSKDFICFQMPEFTVLDTPHDITEENTAQLTLFKTRASELWDCWQESGLTPLNSQAVSRDSNGRITGDAMQIDRHAVKAVFLDYRVFESQDEGTHFFKIINILKRYWRENPIAMNVFEQIKTQWQNAGFMNGFSQLATNELIRLVFNTRYFHSGDAQQRQDLDELLIRMDENLMMDFLVNAVYDRVRVIKMLNTFLEVFSADNRRIQLPNNWLAQTERDLEASRQRELQEQESIREDEEYAQRAEVQEEFNRTNSFDESMISSVTGLFFGQGVSPESIALEISGLSVADARGIVNNIRREACERLGEEFRLI